MKIWRFFKIPKNIEYMENMNLEDKFPLIAITTNKRHAKEYRKAYKKDSFTMRCDDCAKKEVKKYMETNRGKVLDYYKLYTYKNKSLVECKSVKVLMSDFEYRTLEEITDSFGFLMDLPAINPDIFNYKIELYLDTLSYTDFYCLMTSDYLRMIDMGRYPSLDFDSDELAVFLKLNINYLNLDEVHRIIKYD